MKFLTGMFLFICSVANLSANDDIKYMAEAIYFEARGEALVGQIAVGCVIRNRVEARRWPNTVREVVHQRRQFSYYWDGKPEIMSDTKAKFYATLMAKHVMNSNTCMMYEGIDHYINHSIADPKATWYENMELVIEVGQHTFYRSGK